MITTQTELKPFVAALTNACRFIERRVSIPVLETVKIKGTRAYVELDSTDLDTDFTHHLPNTLESGPGDSAEFLLRGHDLLKLCKAALKDYDRVTFRPDNDGVNVEFGDDFSSHFETPIPVKDFPTMACKGRDFTTAFEVSRDDLVETLRLTAPFASEESTRYYLNGVHLENMDNKPAVRFVATDGHRLSAYQQQAHVNGGWPATDVIIPNRAIKALQAILKPVKDGVCRFAFSGDSFCRVETPEGILKIKLIDGTYPDYRRVIPTANDRAMQFASRDALVKAIDQVSALTEKDRAVLIVRKPKAGAVRHDDDRIELSMKSPEGTKSLKALVGWSHRDAPEIGVNARYLQDIAKLRDSDGPVTLRVNGPNDPMLVDLGIEGHTMVLMPMRV